MTLWTIYKQVSPRFAIKVGSLIATIDYTREITARACSNYRKGMQRRHKEKFKAFLGDAGTFRDGWT